MLLKYALPEAFLFAHSMGALLSQFVPTFVRVSDDIPGTLSMPSFAEEGCGMYTTISAMARAVIVVYFSIANKDAA